MLHSLVCRPILAQSDRVVREHKDRTDPHQRSHSQGIADSSRKRSGKVPTVGYEPTVQGNAIHDGRAHAKLAHTVVDVIFATLGLPIDLEPDQHGQI